MGFKDKPHSASSFYMQHFRNEKIAPEYIMNLAREQILQGKGLDLQKYQQLSDFLNAVFYPDMRSSRKQQAAYDEMMRIALDYINERLNTSYKRFEMGGLKELSMDERKALLHEAAQIYVAEDHKYGVWKKGLIERAKLVNDYLDKINNGIFDGKVTKKDLAKARSNLTQLQKFYSTEIVKYLGPDWKKMKEKTYTSAQHEGDMYFSFEKWGKNNDFQEQINKADSLLRECIYFGKAGIAGKGNQERNTLKGDIFEKLLQALCNIDFTKATINEIKDSINKGFNQKTAGNDIVKNFLYAEEFDNTKTVINLMPDKGKGRGATKEVEIEKVIVKGNTWDLTAIDNPYKQGGKGKVDAVFDMPGPEPSHFNISAKNWSQLDSTHGFEIENIYNSLVRVGGLHNTISWVAQTGWGSEIGDMMNYVYYANASNYAKMAIFLDLVMGYGQTHNWADTLVINNQRQSRIEVYSIAEMIDKVYADIDNFTLSFTKGGGGETTKINDQSQIYHQIYGNRFDIYSHRIRDQVPKLLKNVATIGARLRWTQLIKSIDAKPEA